MRQSGKNGRCGDHCMRRVALVGVPNCGKSALFNRLTGGHAHVGNRAGVTVLGKTALMSLFDGERVEVIDLPGIRSMRAVSADECETLRVLVDEPPDMVLFVCDATDFVGQYALLCELIAFMQSRYPMEQGRSCGNCIPPLIAVFNCCDALEHFPNSRELSVTLGLPCAAVSARTGKGMDGLRKILHGLLSGAGTDAFLNCHLVDGAQSHGAICNRVLSLLGREDRRTERFLRCVDRLLLHPASGFLLFACVMGGILWVVFGGVGEWLSAPIVGAVSQVRGRLARAFPTFVPAMIRDLLLEGVLGGVGAILDFLPRLCLLFLCRSILEQTGLLARFNCLFARPMSYIGLGGEAMTAVILGFGCTVPAVLCTRGMRDRCAARRCAGALPLIPCSARMPLCMVLAQAFFADVGKGWVAAAVWLLGGLSFLLFCALDTLVFQNGMRVDSHNDRLPRWRLPTLSETLLTLWEEITHFLSRAGGTILLCSLLLWCLSRFDMRLRFLEGTENGQSLLAGLGGLVAPVLSPLGLGCWQIAAAILVGFGAREATLSALAVLLGCSAETLPGALAVSGLLTPASALSLIVFYTLCFPCAATVATLRAEKYSVRRLFFQIFFAYLLAWAVYALSRRIIL